MLYAMRRLAEAVLVVLGISLAGFSIFQFVGDPVLGMVGPETTEAERAQMRATLGLDRPVVAQFARYVARAAAGDFGLSYTHKRPVLALLAERLPATAEIVFLASAVAIALAIPLGAYTAVRRRGLLTDLVLALSVFGVAVPTFLLGISLIMIFSVWLGVLPSFGRGATLAIGGVELGLATGDGWLHALMPAAVMCLFQLGVLLRLVRGEMLEVLRTDFIRFCWARGLPGRVVYSNHALRNTMVPVLTTIGVQIGALLAFSVVTERVFQWPGLGQLLLQAIQFADIPVLSAYLVFVGVVFMGINLFIDVAYRYIDPRMRSDA